MQEPRAWSHESFIKVATVSFLLFLLASSHHTGSWKHWRLGIDFLAQLGYERYCQYASVHMRFVHPEPLIYILHSSLRAKMRSARGCQNAELFSDQA